MNVLCPACFTHYDDTGDIHACKPRRTGNTPLHVKDGKVIVKATSPGSLLREPVYLGDQTERIRELETRLKEAEAQLRDSEAKRAEAEANLVGMAVELHAAINEPMYSGTRQDWINRCLAAERERDMLQKEIDQRHIDSEGWNV